MQRTGLVSTAGDAVDRAAALSNVGGDVALLREIVELFLEECPRMVEAIQRGIDAGDAAGVQRAAHTLKGSVSVFGAHRTVELALQLECMGRAGDLTGAAEAMGLLAAELDRVGPALRRLAAEPGPMEWARR